MSEYTPGPWTLEEAAHGRVYVQGNDASTARDIAMVYRPGRRETADADARLIAAAPELLEAAKKAEAWFSTPTEDYPPEEASSDIVDDLRAAIAKAKGHNA